MAVNGSIPWHCLAGVKARCVHCCWVAGNTLWSHMASDIPQLWVGVSLRALLFLT